MDRVRVKPEMLRWACERAGFEPGALAERIPRLASWLRGEAQPTLKQLESFALATHTPVGYLFLPEPLVEEVPIPDFRTMDSERLVRPSADLLDTLYLCQQRQEWYRDLLAPRAKSLCRSWAPRAWRATSWRRPPACAAPSASTWRSAVRRQTGRWPSAVSSGWRTSLACW
jgi:hypothetical protein